MQPHITLRRALEDPQLLASALPGESFRNWRVILTAAMGEPLDDAERAIFQRFTEREPPTEPVREMAAIVGRRGGKDRAVAALAAWLGTCCAWPMLAKGEAGRIMVIAPDLTQSRVQHGYILGALESSPVLSSHIVHNTADTIELDNGITIECRGSNYRRLRGFTAIAVIASESAFWFDDSGSSANPDSEILRAVRPTLLTTHGPLIQISTPHAKRGELWNSFRRHYGKPGRVLVVQAESQAFNPTLDTTEIEQAYRDDLAFASAEYGAQFRDDLAQFVSREILEACVSAGVTERPQATAFQYRAFCDPSGGSSDSMTLAIAHGERDEPVVLDCLREVIAPFSPESAVEEFCSVLRRYRVSTVTGDRYAGEWPREQFRKRGIIYETSDLTASDLFRELLPALNTRSIALLDNKRAIGQLANLERRVGRAGRDIIDHPRGSKNDVANVIAGVVWLVQRSATQGEFSVGFYGYGGAIHWMEKPERIRVLAMNEQDEYERKSNSA